MQGWKESLLVRMDNTGQDWTISARQLHVVIHIRPLSGSSEIDASDMCPYIRQRAPCTSEIARLCDQLPNLFQALHMTDRLEDASSLMA